MLGYLVQRIVLGPLVIVLTCELNLNRALGSTSDVYKVRGLSEAGCDHLIA